MPATPAPGSGAAWIVDLVRRADRVRALQPLDLLVAEAVGELVAAVEEHDPRRGLTTGFAGRVEADVPQHQRLPDASRCGHVDRGGERLDLQGALGHHAPIPVTASTADASCATNTGVASLT
jgi:hypothetical protein